MKCYNHTEEIKAQQEKREAVLFTETLYKNPVTAFQAACKANPSMLSKPEDDECV